MSDSPTAPMTNAMENLMKPDEVKLETPSTSAATSTATSVPPTPDSPKPKREMAAAGVAADDDDEEKKSPPAKKQKKKCGICKKKLGLTGECFNRETLKPILYYIGFECRCGHFYCGIHRYSDQHNCPFDYKVRPYTTRRVLSIFF